MISCSCGGISCGCGGISGGCGRISWGCGRTSRLKRTPNENSKIVSSSFYSLLNSNVFAKQINLLKFLTSITLSFSLLNYK